MENMRVRDHAKQKNVKLWQVAEVYGCNDGNFSRKLRRELPEEVQDKLCSIIDAIASTENNIGG